MRRVWRVCPASPACDERGASNGKADIADQFQSNDKMSYMHWIIPNAKENRDAGDTAW